MQPQYLRRSARTMVTGRSNDSGNDNSTGNASGNGSGNSSSNGNSNGVDNDSGNFHDNDKKNGKGVGNDNANGSAAVLGCFCSARGKRKEMFLACKGCTHPARYLTYVYIYMYVSGFCLFIS